MLPCSHLSNRFGCVAAGQRGLATALPAVSVCARHAPTTRSSGSRAPSRATQRCRAASSRRQPPVPQDDGDSPQEKQLAVVSLSVSAAGALALSYGAHLGVDAALPVWAQAPSAALGWSYVLAWSLSFYPQLLQNAQRQSVEGLSADYLVYSMLGYAAYAAYTSALHFSPGVQAAYMLAHGGSAPDVQLTDVVFAGHALLVTLATLWQCVLYGGSSGGSGLATSRVCNITAAGVLLAVAAFCGHIGSTCGLSDCDAWLPLLYLLGFIKVAMTLIKYTPQALLNAQRQSTEGWSISNVLLDLSGGLLSFGQVGLNAAARADLSLITGTPAKLGIALLSVAFDALFIAQHYVWYSGSNASAGSAGQQHDAAPPPPSSQRQQQQQQQQLPQRRQGGPAAAEGKGSGARPRRLAAVAVRAARSAARS